MGVMTTVNEQTTLIVTVEFFDQDGVAVVPSAATYGLDDVATGKVIVAAGTAFPSLGTTVNLEITSTQNSIVDTTRPFEIHRLTVSATYATTRKVTDEYLFRVTNLAGVT